MRRKGERKYVHPPLYWSEDGNIARRIRTGDGWLDAWIGQQCIALDHLAQSSGVDFDRLVALCRSDDVSDAELEAIAPALRTDLPSLRASIHCQASQHRQAGQRSAVLG